MRPETQGLPSFRLGLSPVRSTEGWAGGLGRPSGALRIGRALSEPWGPSKLWPLAHRQGCGKRPSPLPPPCPLAVC